MTAEKRIFIEIKDIVAIELTCPTCGSQVRYPILQIQTDHFRRLPHNCSNCRTSLLGAASDAAETNRIADMVEGIQAMTKAQTNAIIRLEIRGGDAAL